MKRVFSLPDWWCELQLRQVWWNLSSIPEASPAPRSNRFHSPEHPSAHTRHCHLNKFNTDVKIIFDLTFWIMIINEESAGFLWKTMWICEYCDNVLVDRHKTTLWMLKEISCTLIVLVTLVLLHSFIKFTFIVNCEKTKFEFIAHSLCMNENEWMIVLCCVERGMMKKVNVWVHKHWRAQEVKQETVGQQEVLCLDVKLTVTTVFVSNRPNLSQKKLNQETNL